MKSVLLSPIAGRCIACWLSLAGLACAAPPPPGAGVPAESAALLLPRIRTMVGDAPCDSDAQCRSIGVGFKACGGPAGYLAWSTRNVRQSELEALVRAHVQAERAESERAGMVSDCRYIGDPGAACRAGRCQLQPSGGSAAGTR
ncbi:MAG TPA: hypothetical protein VJN44_00170 [Roseateles sp.]|nr:hypothetical protein [Roseateles sp.]